MSPDLRVGVVIATRNRADELCRTLARLAALPERPRVVVVDNASSDGTAEAVRAYHPTVDLVPLPRNVGALGRNTGVERLRTPYIAFSDDDSWWAPGALSSAADMLDACSRLGLLAARILVGPEERLDPTCAAMANSPLRQPAGLPGPAVLGFVACGSVVRRAAFQEVGGVATRFAFAGEEEMLALDLAVAGWSLAYVESVVAYHHPSSRRDPASRERNRVRNTLWAAWLRRRLPGALRRTRRLLWPTLRDPAARAGLMAGLRGLPGVLRERKPVPPEVERRLRLMDDARMGSGARRYVS